jgi:hypothetical protein
MRQGLCENFIIVPHEVKITFKWNLISKQFFQWQNLFLGDFLGVKF